MVFFSKIRKQNFQLLCHLRGSSKPIGRNRRPGWMSMVVDVRRQIGSLHGSPKESVRKVEISLKPCDNPSCVTLSQDD